MRIDAASFWAKRRMSRNNRPDQPPSDLISDVSADHGEVERSGGWVAGVFLQVRAQSAKMRKALMATGQVAVPFESACHDRVGSTPNGG